MAKSLKKQLNRALGFDEISFIIPHVFLPPRFKKVSRNRNMIMFMDMDTVLHVKWEGSRQDEHHPLTPGACRRLFKECISNMKRYRKDLDAFSRFVDNEAEVPFWDPRRDSLNKDQEEKPAPSVEEEEQEEKIVAVVGPNGKLVQGKISDFLEEEMGGESPIPFGWE
ncbi:hypothetical protein LCGC14_0693360 [marine sediment metagenome]|uniref:Uncharacterized protein n=1 Tax=marine sediment metagenome TaxID=412755 RepID=A0A0F9T653_9ZZZZ